MISHAIRLTDWQLVYNLALATEGKPFSGKLPSSAWKTAILRAEHSPIRALMFHWTWTIPYWVSVHLSRHKHGIEHFVSTQRSDRTGVKRDELPQGAIVLHSCIANAQAILNLGRKRLCWKASPETKSAVEALRYCLMDFEPELAELMQPACLATGRCFEIKPCGKVAK